ncbi:MAG: DNA-binding protein [Leptolyngbya sp. PLA2]|nr:DNA-binding protein [Leptolyngbya sp.]MCE7971678.1 DNA-binding protein [Leptolyngbya sp. PL-A2]MCQ3940004.1 hypothetical protein [cyanobacterium CYA1]MDL1903253.1 helix-turn-helix domain-containing protein [Synechococcales cyanobacterium CNB]
MSVQTVPLPEAPAGVGLLTTEEAARYLSISAKEMERMRREGRGPRWAKFSRKLVRYSIEELREWVAQRTVSNTAEGKAMLRREGGAA